MPEPPADDSPRRPETLDAPGRSAATVADADAGVPLPRRTSGAPSSSRLGLDAIASPRPAHHFRRGHLAALFRRAGDNFTVLDVTALGLLTYFAVRLELAPDGADALAARPVFRGTWALLVAVLLVVRGELMRPSYLRGLLYRLGLMASILGSYAVGMRAALHALQPTLLDHALAAADRAIFGVVPAQWLEQLAHPWLVEWLAFWYFSYFAVLAFGIIPAVVRGADRVSAERLFGVVFMCAVGHVLYTLVPGKGPYAALPFEAPLAGGPFWGIVQEAVHSSGPLIDIFPSLHTGFTVFIALHTYQNRSVRNLRRAWPVAAFAAFNIMIATIFLRWHYAVDVLAGLVLAWGTTRVAAAAIALDTERVANGRQATFVAPADVT